MPKQLSSDAIAYDKEYDAFIKQLEDFHQQRGTPFKKLPRINGKSIDLYLLYVVVTARGGWQKVNSRNEWCDILEDFRLHPSCVNSTIALKQIYVRYLDVYERIHYLGEDGNEQNNDGDEDDSRAVRLRKSVRNLNNVPMIYNHQQHSVTENSRVGAAMSTDLYKPSTYDRLALSLTCPLPNEHDFAFNMCTLLSNEGKHTLQLSQCNRLIDLMLAHTGVFKDKHTKKYFISNYKESRGKSLVQFWIDSVEDKSVLDLLSTDCMDAIDLRKSGDVKKAAEAGNDIQPTDGDLITKDISVPAGDSTDTRDTDQRGCLAMAGSSNTDSQDGAKITSISTKLEEVLACEVVDLRLEPEDAEIFHLGRDLGLLDSEGTRISQVLHILRNLSFEEINVSLLAQSTTCLRFLVLCVCSRWGGLSIGALDTLGNIASEVTLNDPAVDPTSSLLLTTICQGVSTQDRAFVLRCLEVLNKLSISENNEEILNLNVDQMVFDQICRYLTVHDIMLLIFTLECLYSLSSLGEQTCNLIVRSKGVIQTLISLLTVEAQSYGPDACIGMKVVETVTGVVRESEGGEEASKASNSSNPTPAQQTNTPNVTATPLNTPTIPTQSQQRLLTQNIQPATPKSNIKPIIDPKRLIASRVVPQEVEDFSIDWIKRNYESCSANAIEQAIVYRHFSASMHAVGKKQGVNPIFLSSCIKKVFGYSVGPCKRQVDGQEKWHYVGIKRRDGVVVPGMVDTTTGHNPNPILPAQAEHQQVEVSNCQQSIQGSILKAHLSSPLKIASPMSRMGGQQQAFMRNTPVSPMMGVDPKNWPNPVVRPNPTDNSTLIKGLLASKVTSTGANLPQYDKVITPECHAQHHQEPPVNISSVGVVPPQMTSKPATLQCGPLPHMPLTKLVYSNQMMLSRQMQNLNGPMEGQKSDGVKSVIVNGLSNEGTKLENENLPTSFEGILQNGLTKEIEAANKYEEQPSKKNLLADLLEKTVGEDVLNGVVDKEIRITDKNSRMANLIKQNGPPTLIQSNPIGLKRTASQDGIPPTKKMALDDAGRSDGKITLYVSQNGNEGEILSQGHQIILNQGHQLVSSGIGQGQVVSSQTMVTPQGQVIIQRALVHPNVVQSPLASSQISSKPFIARNIISQSPGIVQVPQNNSTQAVSTGAQVLNSNGQFLHQVIGHNNSGQKVILPGGQVILPQNSSQGIMVQGSNNLAGQLIMPGVNNQNSVIVQGANGHNQVILQGSNNQGQVILQSSQSGQIVMSGTTHTQSPLVVSSSGQPMILANSQGQSVVVGNAQSGHQVVMSGSVQNNQGQQVLVQGNTVGNTMFLASHQQQTQSGQKTLIILPNPKMVVGGNQSQAGQVMLPRQVVQMVSNNSSVPVQSAVRPTTKPPSSSVNSPISIQVNTAVPLPKGPMATPVTITSASSSSPHVPAPQVIASGVVRRPSKGELQYVCEWRGCNQPFSTPGLVYHHACKVHCPAHFGEITCQWNGCEPMTRRRYSAMTHIHDRHCNEQLLQIHAMRRQQLAISGKTDIPMPQTPPPHPGYATNAAFHAIKRHSVEVINQRDAVEKEGPVTKSIRLTAALILRNLVIYSNLGKELLVGYESDLANVAISCMEASRTVGQMLYYISTPPDS